MKQYDGQTGELKGGGVKPYFAKWLPVEGEAKEGEFCLIEDDDGVKIGYLPLQKKHQQEGTLKITKVKLFLCSRDIQVGDKVNEGVIVDSIEMGSGENHYPKELIVWHVNKDDNSIKYWLKLKDCFKVIGEISSDAIWVKEGDEFEEEEIHRRFAPREWPTGTVALRCSTCKTFH